MGADTPKVSVLLQDQRGRDIENGRGIKKKNQKERVDKYREWRQNLDRQTDRQTDRVVYFDVLRISAIMAVIILHTAAQNWYSVEINSFAWRTFNFFDSISRWGVPVFTMISGALLLPSEKTADIKKVYSKYISPKIVAFVFWSGFYSLLTYLTSRNLVGAIANLISGHYHLWFLFMIIGLYMILPFLKLIVENKETERYFLLLSFLFTIFFPAILTGIQCVDTLAGLEDKLYSFADSVYSKVNFHFTVGYSFYFVLGHYFHTVEISHKTELILYALGLFGFAATIFLTKYASLISGSPVSAFYGNFTLNVMLEAIAVFTFAKNRLAKWFSSERAKMRLMNLSNCCFGVYCIHPFFLNVFSRFRFTSLSFNPVFAVLCISSVAAILSLITTIILRKISVFRKFIV